jgi:hypothetical protein
MSDNTDKSALEPISYRTDRINAEIGKLRLTNEAVAEKATEIRRRSDPTARPMAPKTVALIRDGDPNVRLPTLSAVVEAIGLTLHAVFEPIEESEIAA